jgi:hypothetical protein
MGFSGGFVQQPQLELKFYITYQDVEKEPKKSEYTLNPCMFWGTWHPFSPQQKNR